ncbi:hypothetical protein [Vibrio ziniensis]|uniref:Lipoprotein n=1 Tax=Vibrio ziniensis TaxID=2711221 RepID=A0A6G7CN14_9VIBR|nr:hypothetical protein [Vibrio ziniensis]QIH43464.1 hypothetical protein G5S32_15820 [Vibrio ziniensis]
MKKQFLLVLLVLGGCTNYHVEQNSRNGMTSCSEKGTTGNLVLKRECSIKVEPKPAK